MPFFHRISIIILFTFIAISQYIFEPAYIGYLLAFTTFLAVVVMQKGNPLLWFLTVEINYFLVLWLMLTVFVTIFNGGTSRDILRDMGSVIAFLIGRYAIGSSVKGGQIKNLFEALSVVSIFVAMATMVGALLAYRDGATSYSWRGSYVPMAHSWLPYFLIINITLGRLYPHLASRCIKRTALCVLGTIVSLSRTDFLLELFFGIVMVYLNRREIFSNSRNLSVFIVGMTLLLGLLYVISGLDVVQQRFELGVGEDDASLQWRFIENLALLDYFDLNGFIWTIVGFGWGARLPLPSGVLDFDGNSSIPLLHNSLLTIALKFGLLGLTILLVYMTQLALRCFEYQKSSSHIYAFAGGWLLIFNFGKAITLQGLTEWSHLLFFGIGCMLISLPND